MCFLSGTEPKNDVPAVCISSVIPSARGSSDDARIGDRYRQVHIGLPASNASCTTCTPAPSSMLRPCWLARVWLARVMCTLPRLKWKGGSCTGSSISFAIDATQARRAASSISSDTGWPACLLCSEIIWSRSTRASCQVCWPKLTVSGWAVGPNKQGLVELLFYGRGQPRDRISLGSSTQRDAQSGNARRYLSPRPRLSNVDRRDKAAENDASKRPAIHSPRQVK